MNVKMIYDVYEKKRWRKDATDERDADMKKRLMRNRVASYTTKPYPTNRTSKLRSEDQPKLGHK